MEFDRDELKKIKQQVSAGSTAPPRLVLHAAAALIQGREVRRAVASHQRVDRPVASNETPKEAGTVWRVLALLDGGLVSVVGKSDHGDWVLGSVDTELDGDLDARFIPLSEVTGCAVTQILPAQSFGSSEGPFACRTRWTVTVRDGSSVQIPWRDSGDGGAEAHEAFAHDLVDLLSAR